ncbi:LOW QUALITY PROTEIN: transmembrane protein 212 [Pluvialis apricaria]
MKVKSLYGVARGTLITFGVISFFFPSGIFAFFPLFFSYKPWFIGGSACLAGPIWNGALWEASFTFGTLSVTGTSVQFVAAIACLLLGPYCYWIAGTNYLGYRVLFPLPADFLNLCKTPLHDWYHLTLQILDLCSNLAIFCASLGFSDDFCETAAVWTLKHECRSQRGRWIATCNAVSRSQEGGIAVQGQADPACTRIRISSATEAMCIILLNHFMNQ